MTFDQIIKGVTGIFLAGLIVGYFVPRKMTWKIGIAAAFLGCMCALTFIFMVSIDYDEKNTIMTILGIGVSLLIFMAGSELGFYVETKREKKN